jgi:DNA-binding NarL/FixJ family response regulator
MGLNVQAVVPDDSLEKCAFDHCEMIIISVGNASVGDLQQQTLMVSARRLLPEVPLVIISDREEAEEVLAAFNQGAVGFMPTSTEPAVAFQALSFIKSGGSYFPPSVLSNLRNFVGAAVPSSDLTPKQEEVFGQIRKGHSNKIIARQLGMSEATVKVHVRRIMHKFGVANRTQLAVAAVNDERGSSN